MTSPTWVKLQPTPIVQYWHEPEPPRYIANLLATFPACNRRMPHLVFDTSAATTFIEQHFGEREVAAFQTCAVPAMQADYFRYCAILALGGIYVDADFGCQWPLRSLVDNGCGWLFESANKGNVLNGFFAFRSPGHPLLDLTLEVATANIENRTSQSVRGVTGPAIFSGLAQLHRAGSIDSFLKRANERQIGINRFGKKVWDPNFLCTVIGDYGRVATAFEGVRISPFAKARVLLETNPHTPYKETGNHWPRWTRSIYASPSSSETLASPRFGGGI